MKKCIECGTIVNDNVSACPNCGLPTNYSPKYVEPKQQNNNKGTQQSNYAQQQDANASYQANYYDSSNVQQDYGYGQNGYKPLIRCSECGIEMSANALKCPHCGKIEYDILQITYNDITTKCCRFSGRATRMEYFTVSLFSIFIIIPILIPILGLLSFGLGALVGYIALLIHLLGLQVRRLHDVNRSGWWVLLTPVAIFFCMEDSNEYENDYGYSPKYQPEMF